MKKLLSLIFAVICILSFSACLKKSTAPCSECGNKDAYLYKIERIGKKVLEEKTTVSYCKSCYNIYLEETFGYGLKQNALEEDAHFKDVVGSGGYIDDLIK